MLFIAEIGLNHNGNFDLAYELIRQAKYAGADVAKFQCGWRQKEGELNHMTPEVLVKLKSWCDYFEIEFMASVFNENAYTLLKAVEPERYKLASRTLKDEFEFAKKVVNENQKTIASLGMWPDHANLPFDTEKVDYLWCKSVYPAQPWEMTDLPKDFTNSPYSGYSDHTIGIETCLLAIARGAKIIEKHFTLDKSSTVIRDHTLSATPEEFRILVNLGRELHKRIELGV